MIKDAIVKIDIDSKDKKAIQRAKDRLERDLLESGFQTNIESVSLFCQLMDKLQNELDKQ